MTTDMQTLDTLPFVLRASLPAVKVEKLDDLKDPVVGELLSRFIEEKNPSIDELAEMLQDLSALESVLNSYTQRKEDNPRLEAIYTTDGTSYQGGIQLNTPDELAGGNYGWFMRAHKLPANAQFSTFSQKYHLLTRERTAGLGIMFSGLQFKETGEIFVRNNHHKMLAAIGRQQLGTQESLTYEANIPLIVVAHELGHRTLAARSAQDLTTEEKEAEKSGFHLYIKEGFPAEHYQLYHESRGGAFSEYALSLLH